jgi:uroporphyrinogen III methyltransferase/synthase
VEIQTVYLVGAGPGNPGLLTLRAVECLADADLVIYDKLVNKRLLEYAPNAKLVCITQFGGVHRERHQPCQDCMIEAARRGQRVVRLKGGDPFLFGRGGEEAEALRQAGVPFEVVPGVTAALGAAAYAGVPLTHREHASAVAFLTGHEVQTNLDWGSLARFPGTLVVYMGLNLLEHIRDRLLREGKPPITPVAVVHWATTGEQRTVAGTLCDVVELVRAAEITSPALVIVGSVVTLCGELAWFQRQPLFGKCVLVTRPRQQAGDMVGKLEILGAVPLVLPVVEVRPPQDWSVADAVIERLADYNWLVFTSGNGVRFFLDRMFHCGHDLRRLGRIQLAAIGPSTAHALADYHLTADVVPDDFNSEGLVGALRERVAGQRVLLARADRGRDLLREELGRVADVEQVVVYSQVDALEHDSDILDRLHRGAVDYVSLTSSNIARALIRLLDEADRRRVQRGELQLVTISPETSKSVREEGLPVAAEATEYTVAGVIEAMRRLAVG